MIRSICIIENVFYYSNSYIGNLLDYLNYKLDIKISQDNCDQGQVLFQGIEADGEHIDGRYAIYGDAAIEGILENIKNLLPNKKLPIVFEKNSIKCLNKEVIKSIHIQIDEEYLEVNPLQVERL